MRHTVTIMAIALCLGLMGCTQPEAPDYLYGHNLSRLELNLVSLEMGIHPDTSVLEDENNPFRSSPVGPDTRWDINDNASDIASFYSWATLLAFQPNGEHQFYTALKLKAIYLTRAVAPGLLPFIRDMAIAAFQSVLDNFPGSVTFDATGTIPFSLPPLAYQEILTLGGTIQNGWVLVQTPGGGVDVVRGETDL